MSKKLINIIIILLMLIISPTAFAQEDLSEKYDENTEILLKGIIVEITVPQRGPVILKVKSNKDGKIYNLVTAPQWFLTKNNLSFNSGDNIEIIGSKLITPKGELFIITRKCKMRESDYFLFRDQNMRPHWRGAHNR